MALSHSETSGIIPSDELVQNAMDAARSRWASKGLDDASCTRHERRLDQLAATPAGRFILVNGGWNGFWTNYLANIGCDMIRNHVEYSNNANEAEEYLVRWFARMRGEHELCLRSVIAPMLKPGAAVASIACGLMSEVLLAAEHFEDVKLYAIDIDKTNFNFIRKMYGDRLVGNEFHAIEADALTLNFESTFDLITCLGFVMYLNEEHYPELLARIFRALKPGGHLLLSFLPDLSEMSPRFQYNPARHPVGREIFMCTEARFATRPSTTTMLRYLSEAGFVRMTIHGGTYYYLPFIDAIKPDE